MLNLTITQELIKYLKGKGFYPDTLLSKYVILYCLYNHQEPILDDFDDFSTSKRFMVLYIELMKDGFVTENGDEYIFKLTPKAITLMEEINQILKPEEKEADKVDDWIQEWIELFPSGVKTGGKLVRSDKKSAHLKMKKFVKNYKFDKDTIFKATQSYLQDRERNGWQYTKAAVYFIDKRDEGSGLAEWCEKVAQKKPDILGSLFVNNSGLI